MKIIIRPVMDPQREVDLTNRIVAAIAEELWRLYGGNEQLNWLEAEQHLQRIVGGVRGEAAETVLVTMSSRTEPDVPGRSGCPRPPAGAGRRARQAGRVRRSLEEFAGSVCSPLQPAREVVAAAG